MFIRLSTLERFDISYIILKNCTGYVRGGRGAEGYQDFVHQRPRCEGRQTLRMRFEKTSEVQAVNIYYSKI